MRAEAEELRFSQLQNKHEIILIMGGDFVCRITLLASRSEYPRDKPSVEMACLLGTQNEIQAVWDIS